MRMLVLQAMRCRDLILRAAGEQDKCPVIRRVALQVAFDYDRRLANAGHLR
jgi:hypothetical protein